LEEVEVVEVKSKEKSPYRCAKCGRGYSRRHNRDRHFQIECGQPGRFLCPICSMSFTRKNNVTRHLARKHSKP
jgi:uncharacterized Zn-finger protein